MMATARITNKSGILHIEGELTFVTAAHLFAQSLSLLKNSGASQFDLSAVTHMDSAGLALLCEWKRRNHQAQFHCLPAQIGGMVALSGLEKFFNT
ncbi:MAG: STAS domain-containing protein [Gammaproteobacteria bacterium]|nr:STAS domain-containing protein [Gammaproteobacteria bacterium]MCP4474668.1 STAS domain-containing protein [Gammaproteobacteria bacterium]